MAENKIENTDLDSADELESLEPQNTEPSADYGQVLASWQCEDFVRHERGKIWYLLFSAVILGLLIYSYFSRNPLFAIIIIIGLIVYIISEKRGPSTYTISLTEDGLLINNKFISYDQIDSFYIIYYPPQVKQLYFQPKGNFKSLISIPLENENPVEVRRALLRRVKEDIEKEEAPLSDTLSHHLKF